MSFYTFQSLEGFGAHFGREGGVLAHAPCCLSYGCVGVGQTVPHGSYHGERGPKLHQKSA